MFDMWKDFKFKELKLPMKAFFIFIVLLFLFWVYVGISFYVFDGGDWMIEIFQGKPQPIEAPVEETGEFAELIWNYEPPRFVMILPFEIDFQDEETGDFLGTLEIRNAKNKRVQIFWNGQATSIFFPTGKKK